LSDAMSQFGQEQTLTHFCIPTALDYVRSVS